MKKRLLTLSLATALFLSAVDCSRPTEPSGDGSSAADGYPGKAITIAVPFSADGEHGLTARTVTTRLQEMFGWTITIQSTTGGSAVAVEYIKGDYADNYTLFIHFPEAMAASLINGQLNKPYHEDFVYLGNSVYGPLHICVTADSPYNMIEGLFTAAEEDGSIDWACAGVGGKNEMDTQSLWNIAGVSFNYVPYDDASKSRAAVPGGHAVVHQSYASGARSSIDAGGLKALVIGADGRLDFWPDVPTLRECRYDMTVGLTRCQDIHLDTPQGVVDVLTEKLEECVTDPTTQEQLIAMGQSLSWMTNEEMHEYSEYYYGVYGDIYAKLSR